MKRTRQNRIISEVNRRGSISVRALSRQLGVSEVTIPRDLHELEQEGVVRRAFGVAHAGDRSTPFRPEQPAGGERHTVFRPHFWVVRSQEPTAYRVYRPQNDTEQQELNGWNYTMRSEIAAYYQVNNYRASYELCDFVAALLREQARSIGTVLILSSDAECFDDRIAGFTRRLQEEDRAPVQSHVISRCQSASVVSDALKTYPDVDVIYSVDEKSTISLLETLTDADLSSELPPLVLFGISNRQIREAIAHIELFRPTAGVEVPPVLAAKRILSGVRTLSVSDSSNALREPLDYRIVSAAELQSEQFDETESRVSVPRAANPLSVAHVSDDTVEPEWSAQVEQAVARLAPAANIDLRMFDRTRIQARQIEEARRQIAERAFRLVEPHKVILMSDGAITEALADLLAGSSIETTVITNSTRVFAKLSTNPSIHLISTGGELRPPYSGLVGWIAEGAVSELRADNLMLEPASISADYKLCCDNIAESPMLQAMIRAARRITVLCDCSRFNVGAATQIGGIEVATTLVTDAATPAAVRLNIRERGVEVVT